jgi:hypothetical protein
MPRVDRGQGPRPGEHAVAGQGEEQPARRRHARQGAGEDRRAHHDQHGREAASAEGRAKRGRQGRRRALRGREIIDRQHHAHQEQEPGQPGGRQREQDRPWHHPARLPGFLGQVGGGLEAGEAPRSKQQRQGPGRCPGRQSIGRRPGVGEDFRRSISRQGQAQQHAGQQHDPEEFGPHPRVIAQGRQPDAGQMHQRHRRDDSQGKHRGAGPSVPAGPELTAQVPGERGTHAREAAEKLHRQQPADEEAEVRAHQPAGPLVAVTRQRDPHRQFRQHQGHQHLPAQHRQPREGDRPAHLAEAMVEVREHPGEHRDQRERDGEAREAADAPP